LGKQIRQNGFVLINEGARTANLSFGKWICQNGFALINEDAITAEIDHL